jgi:hypothetical protein
MIDVKIGLAAEFFGQFGEGSRRCTPAFSPNENSVRGSRSAQTYPVNPREWGSLSLVALKRLLLAWLFLFRFQKKGTFENDIVRKRLHV